MAFGESENAAANERASELGREAGGRALAWARMKNWTRYGEAEAAPDVRSGTAPDLPEQTIPRLRGGDACG
ncbi:MAG TPA: hypothetical protein VII58_00895 [Acidobacteriaceae bacterium]